MIIAIFGLSAVGKTAVSQALHELLRCPVRHCGNEVKRKAKALGISLDDMSKEQHDEIDRETQHLARQIGAQLIVEGRFLPEVLSQIPDVQFVEIVCSYVERNKRLQTRNNGASSLEAQDQITADLRSKLYPDNHTTMKSKISINTDNKSVEEVARELVNCMDIRRNDAI